jgi:hypothetical protein
MRQRTLTSLFCSVSMLCLMLPGALEGSTIYSFTGTYSPYSVTISFDTSLTGAALDNLVSADITSTVSNFSETNTIDGNASALLSVIVSTDALGNITTFTITDTKSEIVTETTDSATIEGFAAPPQDLSGRALLDSTASISEIFARYDAVPNDFFCRYFTDSGLLKQDHDDGFCVPTADPTSTNPSAAGAGTFTSAPPNPGAATPEPAASTLAGFGLLGLLAVAVFVKRGAPLLNVYKNPALAHQRGVGEVR